MMRLYQGETGVNTNMSLTSDDRGWFKIESCLEHLRFCSTLEQGLSGYALKLYVKMSALRNLMQLILYEQQLRPATTRPALFLVEL